MKNKRLMKWIALALAVTQVLLPLQAALAETEGAPADTPAIELLTEPGEEPPAGEPPVGEQDPLPEAGDEAMFLEDIGILGSARSGSLPPAGELTHGDGYLVIHGTTVDNPSTITVTGPDDNPISPDGADGAGAYNDIPAGSKLDLQIRFHLNDGDAESNLYAYNSTHYFYIELPPGIKFSGSGSGTIPGIANWEFKGASTIRVQLTDDVKYHTLGMIGISGTFEPAQAGDEDITLDLGGQKVTFNRETPPTPSIDLEKEFVSYDAEANEITWKVTVTPPSSEPSLGGFTLVDTYSANQTYVADSFMGGPAGAASIADDDLVFEGNTVSYTFPAGTSGTQVITYKTQPTDFSAENGTKDHETVTFENTATLKDLSGKPAAEPAKDTATMDWISKGGEAVVVNGDIILKWTVEVNVQGLVEIDGATITDTLPADMVLVEGNSTYPIQIKKGTGAAQTVPADGYTYTAADRKLTYALGDDFTGKAVLTYYTKLAEGKRDEYLDNNGAVTFKNKAGFEWDAEGEIKGWPSDTASVGVVGAGGVVAKSAENRQDYTYGDPSLIKWTVSVNQNKVRIEKASITDTIPAGQKLYITPDKPFTVSGAVPITSPDSSGSFTYISANSFSYSFGTITTPYTVTYYTEITDFTSLYTNSPQDNPVEFGNEVKLYRDGTRVDEATGTQQFNSQVLAKSVATDYNYTDRTVQWQLVVNRNKLPLKNVIVTDTLPVGMVLYIDAGHPFKVVKNGTTDQEIATAPTTVAHGDNTFGYAFGDITDQYTITFYAQLTEEALFPQWEGDKPFKNEAEIKADEIDSVKVDSTVQIKNPVISKTGTYAAGNDYIDWSVIINAAGITVYGGVVTDQLTEDLLIDQASLELIEVAVLANGTPAETGRVLGASEYGVEYPSEENEYKLIITLPTPTTFAYRLNFTTQVLANNLRFTNQVKLRGSQSGPTGDASAREIVISNLWSSGQTGSNALTVLKTDPNGEPVEGAKYELLNFLEKPVSRGDAPLTAQTNGEGKAEFTSLPSWVFYVRETEAPDGYLLDDTLLGGDRIKGTDNVILHENKLAVADVSFSKISRSGVKLNGGRFELAGTNFKQETVTISAAAQGGTVTFKDVPLGTYTIREITPPDGYYLTKDTLTVRVEYADEKKTAVKVVFEGFETPADAVLKNTVIPEDPTGGSVRIFKVDDKNRPLSGAVFGLYTPSGSLLKTATSDFNGNVVFSGIPYGSYTIKEIQAPDGYTLSGTPLAVHVNGSQANAYTFVNYKGTLPKTGSFWDSTVLLTLGGLLVLAGVFVLVRPSLKKKNNGK